MIQHPASAALSAAQSARVEAHLGLVGVALAGCRWADHLDPDDRDQIGRLALCRCVAAHDPARGALSTYAVRAIRLALRAAHSEDRTIRVPRRAWASPAARRARRVGPIGDVEGRRDDDDREDLVALDAAIGRLPDRERDAVRARLAGASYAAMAARWGLSDARWRQIHDAGVRRLRGWLAPARTPSEHEKPGRIAIAAKSPC